MPRFAMCRVATSTREAENPALTNINAIRVPTFQPQAKKLDFLSKINDLGANRRRMQKSCQAGIFVRM